MAAFSIVSASPPGRWIAGRAARASSERCEAVPGNDIIKRRLKSLRQREQEKSDAAAARKAAIEQRAAANGLSIEMQEAVDAPNTYATVCRPMPLSFYYGEGSTPERDAAFMARRAAFYALCAKAFGFEGWHLEPYAYEMSVADAVLRSAFGGRDMKLSLIDQDHASIVNTSAAPLEFMVAQRWLETPKDPPGYGILRFSAAVRFRDEVAGSQSGGLKSQNLEGGSGGFGPRLVSDYALDCISKVSAVRARLHPGLYRLLYMVVIDDLWVWEIDAKKAVRNAKSRPPGKRTQAQRIFHEARRRQLQARRDRIILKLHKALDSAAVVFRYMSEAEYDARWATR